MDFDEIVVCCRENLLFYWDPKEPKKLDDFFNDTFKTVAGFPELIAEFPEYLVFALFNKVAFEKDYEKKATGWKTKKGSVRFHRAFLDVPKYWEKKNPKFLARVIDVIYYLKVVDNFKNYAQIEAEGNSKEDIPDVFEKIL